MGEIATRHLIVAGTDTGIGKTVLSAMLVAGLDACYWKPVQSGLQEETDSECVLRLAGVPPERIIPEGYRLRMPLSPDQSAHHDGITIDPGRLRLPACERMTVVEGAGGLMVPLNDTLLQIDLFAGWGAPVLLAARSGLGTLNHTLLSLEAMRARGMNVLGVVMIGPEHQGNIRSLERWTDLPVLGTIPPLERLDRAALLDLFNNRFSHLPVWTLLS